MNDWLVNERNKHQFKYVKKDNIQDHHFHTMDSINTDKSYLNVSLPNSYSSQISDKTMKKDKKLLYCLILEEQQKINLENMDRIETVSPTVLRKNEESHRTSTLRTDSEFKTNREEVIFNDTKVKDKKAIKLAKKRF